MTTEIEIAGYFAWVHFNSQWTCEKFSIDRIGMNPEASGYWKAITKQEHKLTADEFLLTLDELASKYPLSEKSKVEVPMTTIHSYVVTVQKVDQRKRAVRSHKTDKLDEEGKNIIHVEYENLGWFVWFDASWESRCLGMVKPDLKAGDKVRVTYQKVV